MYGAQLPGTRQRSRPQTLVVLGIILLAIIGAVAFFSGTLRQGIVSPLPKTETVRIIFSTPEPASTRATDSASVAGDATESATRAE